MHSHLRRRGHTPDEADDLIQAFFAFVLEKGTLRRADPNRGRFRSFLLTSLTNFVTNEHDRETAQKRSPGTPPLSLDLETVEGRFQIEPPTDETPEKVFDRHWARTVIQQAFVRLRKEMSPAKALQFEHLKAHLAGDRVEGGYARTAAKLGMSEVAARQEVMRLRLRLRHFIEEEVADTVSSPEEIEDEIRHLLSSLER